MSGVELADVIGKLRDDLQAAQAAGDGEGIKFELGPVEVTLTMTVTSSGNGKAGVKFWVLEAGVEGSLERASAQQIKLTLHPRDMSSPAERGARKSPLITGDALPDEAD